MRRLKVLGLVVTALFALGAFASSSAFALPTFLPEGTKEVPVLFEGKGGAGELVTVSLGGTLAIKCEAVVITGDIESPSKGTYHLKFTGCANSALEKCESTGDAAGVILLLGEFHLVWDSLKPLGVAFLLLVPQFHINCLGVAKPLFLVFGNILILIKNPTTKAPPLELTVEQEKGKPKDTHWWAEGGKEEKALLLTKLNEGAFEESGDSTPTSSIEKFTKGGVEQKAIEIHNV